VVGGDGIIADVLGRHLTSHGFVFVAVSGQGPTMTFLNDAMIDYPLDLVFGLDLLEGGELCVPASAVDGGRSGAVGLSFGSWNALALAFFDVLLRGGTAWAEILTRGFVEDVAPTLGGQSGFEGLAWGVVGVVSGEER
jgi:hypothetical protein